MSHRKSHRAHRDVPDAGSAPTGAAAPSAEEDPSLEVVVKADTVGTLEAARRAIAEVQVEGVHLEVLHPGVGEVAKSDLLMALTGSRLVLGFGVDVMPRVEDFAKEQGVEVRLYDVIYELTHDLEEIARGLVPPAESEKILGQARVIARFKGSRKGVILGCEVQKGRLAVGRPFRVITAMGPVYAGTIESLHIEDHAVRQAQVGQQVGLKISDFRDAGVGDLVESYEPVSGQRPPRWGPTGGVTRRGN